MTNQASDVYATMPEFYNCEVCGRELPTTAKCNPQAHIGLVTSTTNTTDTNQASEDKLAKQIESITQTMFFTLSEWQAGVPIDWHSAKVKGRADLLALIRTEKLKLLAEVRERKHLYNVKSTDGEMNKPNTGIFAIPVTELTKLEAEL